MFGRKAAAQAVKFDLYSEKVRAIVDVERDRLQFTPDYPYLSTKRSHLLFVHDDMAQLQPNHDMVKAGSLSGFYPLAYGYTTRRFSFITKQLELKSFPIALSLRDKDDLPQYMTDEYRIRGEIYAIRPQTFISLDTHRQNGVQFQRVQVNVNIGYRKLRRRSWFDAVGREHFEHLLDKEEMISQPVYMYVGREEYWIDQLKAGFFDFKPVDVVSEDRLWLKEYFQYSRVR